MNPKILDTTELITLEDQAQAVMQQSKPQSYLYETASRLMMIMKMEQIRRGIFASQSAQLRQKTD
ncbi:hypothetical protein HQ393_08470 [Chitinibacter bivalviorum]|uniref:Uncharacterized protein n=1 Tax=Chitinibacter bivalviorum TaxID=2739434 RepID=A0A7H9BJ58_9NEIS|nr:hypothetical protein [Chitinibacter bivalviorum]QLG88278.1 hypothetical protein HQ393_08470 [Chitinibacter bivalviorum]